MSVQSLRDSRQSPVSIYTQFTRQYKQHKQSLEKTIFCFFEGDEDFPYYCSRICNITGIAPAGRIHFNCNGKQGVIRTHHLISTKTIYADAKLAFFVDRDFDASSQQEEIYETPCYSIENLFTSSSCVSEILKGEFSVQETEREVLEENQGKFELFIRKYEELQNQFHQATGELNAWIAVHREKESNLNVKNIKLSDLMRIDLDRGIKLRGDRTLLETVRQRFPDIETVSDAEIYEKLSELKDKGCQSSFRGKFELFFLRQFLMKLAEQANSKESDYFTKKKVSLNFSTDDAISRLSQYADTPNCLRNYLVKFSVYSNE